MHTFVYDGSDKIYYKSNIICRSGHILSYVMYVQKYFWNIVHLHIICDEIRFCYLPYSSESILCYGSKFFTCYNGNKLLK